MRKFLFFTLLTAIITACANIDEVRTGDEIMVGGTMSRTDGSMVLQVVAGELPEYIAPLSVSIDIDDQSKILSELRYVETVNKFSFLHTLTDEQHITLQSVDDVHPLRVHAHILCQDCSEYDCDTLITRIPAMADGTRELTLSTWQRQAYSSTDYSANGDIHVLQRHSEGQGIRLLLLGDGFSDRQIRSGHYAEVMQRAADYFFSVPPFDRFASLFDVWYMDAVSAEEGCRRDATKDAPNRSAFSSWYGSSTMIGADEAAVMKFVEPVLGQGYGGLFNSHIIVILNSTKHAGTTYIYWPSNRTTDYGEGWAFCYLPLAQDSEHMGRLIHHEANGHGFGKLGDEYFKEKNGDYPASVMSEYQKQSALGWVKNIDTTDDPTAVKWAYMLQDPELVSLGTGIYEGALTYCHGFYRPTDRSIMRDNVGSFNAPSAEAIWYRIHKLAYGSDWQYDAAAFRTWFLSTNGTDDLLSIPVITRSASDEEPLQTPIAREISTLRTKC